MLIINIVYNSHFHSLQLAMQLQEEERIQQQQQRIQSRPQQARASPSRANVIPQSQQQSSTSNQQREESSVRQFIYKIVSMLNMVQA